MSCLFLFGGAAGHLAEAAEVPFRAQQTLPGGWVRARCKGCANTAQRPVGQRCIWQNLQNYRQGLSARRRAGGCGCTLRAVLLSLRIYQGHALRMSSPDGRPARPGHPFSGKGVGKAPGLRKNTRWLRLDLTEVSPGHFDPGPRFLWALALAGFFCFR